MQVDAQRARTLSSIAAVVSAFVVFVLGGGTVLGIWASQRMDAEAAAEVAEQETIRLAQEAENARKVELAKPVEVVPTTTPVKRTRTGKKRAKRSVPSSKPAEPSRTEAPPVAAVAKAKAARVRTRTGKGRVIIQGDATRVRLMGPTGTYGAGSLPSGTYTVQATFPGVDPRMAGTVEVDDGSVVNLVCKSSTKHCTPR